MEYPKRRLAAERFLAIKMKLIAFIGFTYLAVLLIFLAWVTEYLLVGTVLANWVAYRWYIPLGIVVMIFMWQRASAREKSRVLENFVRLSSPVDGYPGIAPNTRFETGGLGFDTAVVGPVTIEVNESGLAL